MYSSVFQIFHDDPFKDHKIKLVDHAQQILKSKVKLKHQIKTLILFSFMKCIF